MVVDVAFRLLTLAEKAYAFYETYKARNDERKCVARFMLHMARVLRAIRAVPQHAVPIVSELAALMARAEEKAAKYDDRCPLSAILHMYFEQRKLKKIMEETQQLLPLLTVSVASATDASAAVAELDRRAAALQGASAEAGAHLRHIAAAVHLLAQRSTTALEVQQSMTTLRDSMMLMHQRSMEQVLAGCCEVQVRLIPDADLKRSLGSMRRTAAAFAADVEGKLDELLSRQGDMLAKQDHLGACMQQMRAQLEYLGTLCVLPAGYDKALQSGRNLSALQALSQSGTLTDTGSHTSNSYPHHQWAAATLKALSSGTLKVTSCLVLGVPLLVEGPLRPVTLPCCGFIVSHAGAQQLLRERQCQLCRVPLPAAAALEDNAAAARAVAAEERGIAPRLLRSADVAVGERIGAGSQGEVFRGAWGEVEVAVKKVPLAPGSGPQEIACVRHVIAASHLAAVASPHVCKLHGYCWTDTELWLVLERCGCTLAEYVRRAGRSSKHPGLPPLDVVTLGLMLCCALDAVHRGARYLHLDVKPSNILIKSSGSTMATGAAPGIKTTAQLHMQGVWSAGPSGRPAHAGHAVSARLSDFGLAQHLPTCIGSTMLSSAPSPQQSGGVGTGGNSSGMRGAAAKGTPGFAPPEQLHGLPQRRSDVYGLGATLLYALTGRNPYGNATAHAISFKLFSGVCMEVPDYIEPGPLRSLLQAMTSLDPSSRPPLATVQHRLLSIHTSLTRAAPPVPPSPQRPPLERLASRQPPHGQAPEPGVPKLPQPDEPKPRTAPNAAAARAGPPFYVFPLPAASPPALPGPHACAPCMHEKSEAAATPKAGVAAGSEDHAAPRRAEERACQELHACEADDTASTATDVDTDCFDVCLEERSASAPASCAADAVMHASISSPPPESGLSLADSALSLSTPDQVPRSARVLIPTCSGTESSASTAADQSPGPAAASQTAGGTRHEAAAADPAAEKPPQAVWSGRSGAARARSPAADAADCSDLVMPPWEISESGALNVTPQRGPSAHPRPGRTAGGATDRSHTSDKPPVTPVFVPRYSQSAIEKERRASHMHEQHDARVRFSPRESEPCLVSANEGGAHRGPPQGPAVTPHAGAGVMRMHGGGGVALRAPAGAGEAQGRLCTGLIGNRIPYEVAPSSCASVPRDAPSPAPRGVGASKEPSVQPPHACGQTQRGQAPSAAGGVTSGSGPHASPAGLDAWRTAETTEPAGRCGLRPDFATQTNRHSRPSDGTERRKPPPRRPSHDAAASTESRADCKELAAPHMHEPQRGSTAGGAGGAPRHAHAFGTGGGAPHPAVRARPNPQTGFSPQTGFARSKAVLPPGPTAGPTSTDLHDSGAQHHVATARSALRDAMMARPSMHELPTAASPEPHQASTHTPSALDSTANGPVAAHASRLDAVLQRTDGAGSQKGAQEVGPVPPGAAACGDWGPRAADKVSQRAAPAITTRRIDIPQARVLVSATATHACAHADAHACSPLASAGDPSGVAPPRYGALTPGDSGVHTRAADQVTLVAAPSDVTMSLLDTDEPTLLLQPPKTPDAIAAAALLSRTPEELAGARGRGSPWARCNKWLQGLRGGKRTARLSQLDDRDGKYEGLAGQQQHGMSW